MPVNVPPGAFQNCRFPTCPSTTVLPNVCLDCCLPPEPPTCRYWALPAAHQAGLGGGGGRTGRAGGTTCATCAAREPCLNRLGLEVATKKGLPRHGRRLVDGSSWLGRPYPRFGGQAANSHQHACLLPILPCALLVYTCTPAFPAYTATLPPRRRAPAACRPNIPFLPLPVAAHIPAAPPRSPFKLPSP